MNKTYRGREGEDRAARFLEEQGMRIIARNFRSPYGEIDIIAVEGGALVFTEVKAWSYYSYGDLEYGLNLKKQRRIIETAKYFLAVHREYNCMALRFDVVFISPERISHLTAAFMEHI